MYYIFKAETGTFEGYPICRWKKYWYSDSKTEIQNAYFELVNRYKADKKEILVVEEVNMKNSEIEKLYQVVAILYGMISEYNGLTNSMEWDVEPSAMDAIELVEEVLKELREQDDV